LNLAGFTSRYFIFTGLLIGLVLLIDTVLFPDIRLLVTKFWILFGFVAGLTFIAYVVAYLGIKGKPETGVQAILASITIKLLFCMAFVLVYRYMEGGFDLLFILDFFCLYLLFSVFEIYCLLRNLRT